MKRILQTDSRLSTTYNKKGCLYRDALAIVEEEAGKPFAIGELRRWEADHTSRGLINLSMGLDNPRSYIEILADGFKQFGMAAGGNQVGMLTREGEFKWWGGDPILWHYMMVNHEAGTDDGHWLLCSLYGGRLFNPDPNVKIGKRREAYFIKLWGVGRP